jgi:hypothetical protein
MPMKGCLILPSRRRRICLVLIMLGLDLALPAGGATAQVDHHFNCRFMRHLSVDPVERDGAARGAIARGDWDEVRIAFAYGYPLPRNLEGRQRVLAMRAFRSVQLIAASARGDLPHVSRLLADGADPNVEIHADDIATPLAWAARCNHPSVVERLLSAGARVNNRFTYSDTQSVHVGSTALIWASQMGAVASVRVLLRRGARADIRDSFFFRGGPPRRRGVTALDVAMNMATQRLLRRHLGRNR